MALRTELAALAALAAVSAYAPLAAAQSNAQSDADIAAAERAFKQALADEDAGRCEQAIAALDEARRLAHKETPQVLFHLGVCHARLGRVMAARDELRAAVERAQTQGLQAVAGAARAQLEKAQARVATLVVARPAHGTVKSVALDGVDVTARIGLPVEVDPGRHVLRAAFIEGPPSQADVDVGEGERREVAVPEGGATAPAVAPAGVGAPPAGSKQEPAASAPPLAVPPPSETPPPAPGSGTRTLGWITGAGGLALVAGGVVFWVLRGQENDTLSGPCGPSQHQCPQSLQSDIDKGKLYNALADGLFIAGGAAVLAGAGLVLFGGGHDAPATARVTTLVVAGGGGVGLEGALW